MKKRYGTVAALLCVLLMMNCALCCAEEIVPSDDMAFSVNGKVFTRQEYLEKVSLRAYDMSYAAYLTTGSEQNVTPSQAGYDVAYDMITEEIYAEKIAEMGLDMLTEEEEAAVHEQGANTYSQFNSYAMFYYQVPVSVLAYVYTGRDLQSEEDFVNESIRSEKTSRLFEALTADVKLEESDGELLENTLNSLIDADKQSYAGAAAFVSAYNNGSVGEVFYAPEGVRYVKHVLLQFSDEEKTAISEAKKAVSAAEGEEAAAQAQADLDSILSNAWERMRPLADEIVSRARAGEDFDQLIAEYGEDPGMTREPFSATGYALCADYTGFDPVFLNAAMALEKPGEVAEPAASDLYGFYIIRYMSDEVSGERTLEDVREAVEKKALETKKNDLLTRIVNTWLEEADIRLGAGFFFN